VIVAPSKRGIVVLIAALVALGIVILIWMQRPKPAASPPDAANAEQVAAGQKIYAADCASCHGDKLQGQPNWKERKPDGKLPAPPHDATGHTWHHPDQQLFTIVKRGVAAIVPNYQTDMIGFGDKLSDRDIGNVLAYIKSTWPADIQAKQAEMTRAAAQQDAQPTSP
jgi:mono/diheme cytochrome c family protein